MKIINPITVNIIKNAKNGETIRNLANRIGFAYSAVYKWVSVLQDYDVLRLRKKGNKTIIGVNKNLIYKKFLQLYNAISTIEKDRKFWYLVKHLKLKIRFVKGTAIVIWTKGSYITGDFFDRLYSLEVYKKDLSPLKKVLQRNNIDYCTSEEKVKKINKRPLIYITTKRDFIIARKDGLPIMPLIELVKWCKKLFLDAVLEQLDLLYNLKLKIKYAEIRTNI